MEDSISPAGPVVFDVGGLWGRLAALGDRRHRRGRRYALALVLLLVVLAKLSGEDRPSGIADWVRHRREQLAGILGVGLARVPHHNTYRWVLAGAVEPTELDEALGAFFRVNTDLKFPEITALNFPKITGLKFPSSAVASGP